MSQQTITICDICGERIKTEEAVTYPDMPVPYIDAGVYGVQFHVHCFNKLTPFTLLQYLGADDIKHVDSKGESTKLIHIKNWAEAIR